MSSTSSLFRANFNDLTIVHGIRAAIAFALPLLIGQYTEHIELSILPALAGFFITLIPGGIPGSYGDKFLAMAIATIGSASVVWIGILSNQIPWLVVLLTFIVIFITTFAGVCGNGATASGQVIAIFWLISTHLSSNLELAIQQFCLILLAGAWGTIFSLSGWVFYPYRPVQKSLANSYRILTKFLETVLEEEMNDEDKLWDTITSKAQYKAGIAIGETRQLWHNVWRSQKGFQQKGKRLLLLIQKATEMYREIITLTEVIVGRGKHPELIKIRHELTQALQSLTQAMKILDDVLESRDLDERRQITRETLIILDDVQQQMQELEKKCRKWTNSQDAKLGEMSEKTAHFLPTLFTALRNLAKQINSTINLLLDFKSEQQVSVSINSVPFSSPNFSIWETLSNNWTFESVTFSHALRIATVASFAMLVSASFYWHRGYWIALTVLFVLKPDYGATMQRVAQRISGTVVGAILAAGLVLNVHDLRVLLGIVIIVALLAGAIRLVNYALFILLLTLMVIVVLNLSKPGNWYLAEVRIFHTLVGGILVVISYYIWPIWQRRYLPKRMAMLLQASLTYFQAIASAYQGKEQSLKTRNVMRHKAELASANAMAATERMSQEPKRFQGDLEGSIALLINVNSLISTVTSLSYHLYRFQPTNSFPGFDRFVQQVTDTLQNLTHFYQMGTALAPLPDFNQSLDLAEDYVESLQNSDSQKVQDLTFVVAQLNRLADEVKGMYQALK
ncbi:FUSC family protein [Floridanema evergladense]|uniref:FUSC family protein n=1 Tax=Floridaenema evergladense BLCC-F167 TaxID=3153639 RepID=A0ABV4WM18_9CYAN